MRTSAFALTTLAFAMTSAAAQSAAPTKGWLLLEGGGRLNGTAITAKFVELAGGTKKHYVAITTAISDTEYYPARLAHCERRSAEIFGVAHVTCLAARDRAETGSTSFLRALQDADGVWFYGGDEERLVDRYAGTPVVAAVRGVLERGGVVGGTSAGAMILASYIPIRDTIPAFRFLDSTTILPHFSQRQYEDTLRDILRAHPRLRGIGIDENTAIVVHAGTAEVIGEGRVFVIDRGGRRAVLTKGQQLPL